MKKTLIMLILILSPSVSSAAIGVSFGGLTNVVIPCTCSGGAIISYFPFYNNTKIPTVGTLYYQFPVSFLFRNYNPITPLTFHLGVYTPGIQAACLTGVPPFCVPVTIPVLGMIQYMGTSLTPL